MDELIASLSGGMHVGEDGYDLQQLQQYLSQHLPHVPMGVSPMPISPVNAYRPLPSRSTSTVRKPDAGLPSSNSDPALYFGQEPPVSPAIADMGFDWQATQSPMVPPHRPIPGRQPSYGLSIPSEPIAGPSSPTTGFGAFETDAFAPLWKKSEEKNADPWARMRSSSEPADPALAASTSAFGFGFSAINKGKQNDEDQPPRRTAKPASAGSSGFAWRPFTPANGGPKPSLELGSGIFGRTENSMDDDDDMDVDMEDDMAIDDDSDEEESINTMGLQMRSTGGRDKGQKWPRGRRKTYD